MKRADLGLCFGGSFRSVSSWQVSRFPTSRHTQVALQPQNGGQHVLGAPQQPYPAGSSLGCFLGPERR